MVVVDASTGNGFGIKALDANPAARAFPSEIPVMQQHALPHGAVQIIQAREVKPREL